LVFTAKFNMLLSILERLCPAFGQVGRFARTYISKGRANREKAPPRRAQDIEKQTKKDGVREHAVQFLLS